MLPAFKDVCRSPDCIDLMGKSCDKMLACGHACCGFKNELICLPCLNKDCVDKNEASTKGKTSDDFCVICYSEGLG